MTWEEAQSRCPDGIFAACHNSRDSVSISGPAAAVSEFVAKLQQEGIFAKEVLSAGNAFHSRYMSPAASSSPIACEKYV
jgi:fatty acid synthase